MLYDRRNRLEQAVFIHAKLAVIVWAVAWIIKPSDLIVSELGHGLIYVSGGFAIVGSTMGIAGLLLSNSVNLIKKHQGNIIEFAGLHLAFCGPAGYTLTLGYLVVTSDQIQGYSFAFFGYALCGFIFSRIITVRRELKESH